MIHYTEKTCSLNGGKSFIDFELDAYANLMIAVDLEAAADLEIVLGEVRSGNDSVNREPGGFRIVRTMNKSCPAGKSCFAFDLPVHQSPYWHTVTVGTPTEAAGEVTPFRYVEINGGKGSAVLTRKELYGEFDDNAADFKSSSSNLDRIWDFCKYSMKATGAFGIYIDGERERKPYEGDAFINMLGDLCCGGSWKTAFATLRWLFGAPTYPTEWQLIAPYLLRDFYLYTGKQQEFKNLLTLLERNFRNLMKEVSDDHLLRDGAPHGNQRLSGGGRRDIVDWPEAERDNYDFGTANFVPNCYWYGALNVMSFLTGNNEYAELAKKVKAELIRTMYRPEKGLFVDNALSEKTSLHSVFFPIYFGLTEGMDIEPMKEVIRQKGMACSVYAAHFLIESCFDCGLSDVGLQLMTSDGLRSYNNMLKNGATMTMEAWDDSLKHNQDWTHAWGAAPANLIPRCIGGIRPLEPGFARFSVDPQPAELEFFELKHPTPYGSILLKVEKSAMSLTVPEGTEAVFRGKVYAAGTYQLSL